ncbi:MAG TPA: PQQ-binding-like beta-propeller repeat protein, partial [Vicinamibacterales bacterium]
MTRRKALALVSLVATMAFAASPRGQAQRSAAPTTVNWALHNLNLAGTRYSPLDQINTSNVKSLVPRWLFQHGVIDGVSNQTTPVMVDGTAYVTDARGSVYAVDAADGHLLWSFDVTNLLGGGRQAGYTFRNRGVCYADGVV